ncbi:hypothetical protein BDD12DRAFT_442140 [Trichophaea hybrida]|nr:hypothetical protein BDD12DRAFT_442140 [Trichophaea hybrida]
MQYVSRMIGEVPDRLAQLSEDISAVLRFVSTLSGQHVQQELTDDETEQLLKWLSPLEQQKRHRYFQQKRLENTGEWLLELEGFRTWRDSEDQDHNSVLACYGIPGAGKTFISSLVVDHLATNFSGKNVGVACLYCDYRDRKAQTPVNMIGGLLKQFITAFPVIPKEITQAFQPNGQRSLELHTACDMLRTVLQSFHRSYVCIDALDECNNDDRRTFLEYLGGVMQGSTRLFLASRQSVQNDVKKYLGIKSLVTIQLVANQQDIEKYINHRISEDNRPDIMNDNLRKEIVTTISATSQQLFLLPALQIEAVLEQRTITERRNTLKEMPKGLQDTFRYTIHRIQRQHDVADLAMSVLKWICLARRPLSLEELRHALVVNSTDTGLDWDNLASEEPLLKCCLGLIFIDGGTSTVRFVHMLLEEYLHSQHEELFDMGHSEIAQTCLTYANFDVFKVDEAELSELLAKYPLFDYASCHWGYHVREQASESVQELALRVLLHETTFLRLSQVLWRSLWPPFMMRSNPFSIYHLIAYFGASNIFRLLIQSINTQSQDMLLGALDSRDEMSRTPLCVAARYGHEALVRLLLEQDGVDVNAIDWHGETPLSHAAQRATRR